MVNNFKNSIWINSGEFLWWLREPPMDSIIWKGSYGEEPMVRILIDSYGGALCADRGCGKDAHSMDAMLERGRCIYANRGWAQMDNAERILIVHPVAVLVERNSSRTSVRATIFGIWQRLSFSACCSPPISSDHHHAAAKSEEKFANLLVALVLQP